MMNVNICGVEFKNPVIGASGTYGFGKASSRATAAGAAVNACPEPGRGRKKRLLPACGLTGSRGRIANRLQELAPRSLDRKSVV